VASFGRDFSYRVRRQIAHAGDSQIEARKVHSGVAADYQRTAHLLKDAIKVEQGRAWVEVIGGSSQRVLNSAVVEAVDPIAEYTADLVIPFASFSTAMYTSKLKATVQRLGNQL
jgi:hypothetical protein